MNGFELFSILAGFSVRAQPREVKRFVHLNASRSELFAWRVIEQAFREGDIFVMPAGHRHAEAVGPAGVAYLVGRRHGRADSTNDDRGHDETSSFGDVEWRPQDGQGHDLHG